MATLRQTGAASGAQAPPAPGGRVQHAPTIQHPAYPRFRYMHHPNKWTVIAGRVVAALSQMAIQTGVGGVGGDLDPTYAIAKRVRNGWVEIPEDVDGPGTSYLAVYELRAGALDAYKRGGTDALNAIGGLCFLPKWMRVFPGGPAIEPQPEEYAAWLESLEKRGIINPPETWVLHNIAEKLRGSINENLGKLAKHPGIKSIVDEEQRQLDTVEARIKQVRAAEKKTRKPAAVKSAPASPKFGADDE